MTEASMYWLTRLDQIHSFCNGFEFMLVMLTLVGVICLIIFKIIKESNRSFNHGEDLDRDFKNADNVIKVIRLPTILCFLGAFSISLFTVFLPTTKEMVSIKVIPRIATPENCQKIENISKDFLDVTAKWLEDVKNSRK